MANKQYISIIRLFKYCDIPVDNNFNLQRARKQLQAEFSIAQNGFIEVDDYTYTWQDVFEEIERIDFRDRLIYHKQIWDCPQVLELLENNTFNTYTIDIGFEQFWNNRAFDDFFSPYFAIPFNYLSRTFLAEYKLNELGVLYGFEGFLQPSEREEAFRPVRIFFDQNLKILRNVTKENYKIMRPNIDHWINTNWHIFFNNLPNEFYDTKIDITRYLVNIGVAIQRSHKKDCREMSEQLVMVTDLSENLRGTIVSNHRVYSGSSKSFNWGRAFWVGWIIFMIVKAAASNGCNGNSTTNEQFIPGNPFADSILKRMEKKN